MKIKVLGCDPSMSNTGLVSAVVDLIDGTFVIDSMALLETKPEDKKVRKQVRQNSMDLERASLLARGLATWCTGHSVMIAEVPVGSQSARAMASYGVCIGLLASITIPLIQVNPTEVKFTATGSKHASKEEMIEWATVKYPNAKWLTQKRGGIYVPVAKNEHLADAVGAIEAGIATEQFKGMTAMLRGLQAA